MTHDFTHIVNKLYDICQYHPAEPKEGEPCSQDYINFCNHLLYLLTQCVEECNYNLILNTLHSHGATIEKWPKEQMHLVLREFSPVRYFNPFILNFFTMKLSPYIPNKQIELTLMYRHFHVILAVSTLAMTYKRLYCESEAPTEVVEGVKE